jgi:tetrahydromethanopterin:alpha-L-glutamate ligase
LSLRGPPRIAIATDPPDRHAEELAAALAGLGADTALFSLSACRFDTGSASGLAIPGFGEAVPDAVFVRSISGGSFEAVTCRLGVLHALGTIGVPVWNPARAVERCVDKSTASFLLARAGLPTPRAWAAEGRAAAAEVVAREGGSFVLKPLFGSQGHGLRRVEGIGDLPDPNEVGDVYYLQRWVPPGGAGFRDYRVLVCAGHILAAMARRGTGWITNIHQGASPEPIEPDAEMVGLALRAAACVGAAYAGVDLMRGPDGALLVIEINSMPAWAGLQSVTHVPIARRLAEAVLRSVRTRT